MAEGMGRRQVRSALGLAMLAVLAACQVVPKRRAAPPPPPARVEAPPPAVTQGLPTDGERHRVAVLVPLTGSNAAVGTSIANAANMAVMDTGGQRIRVTVYDTAAGAAAAASRAIAEGNRLILGPLTAEEVRAVAPVARGAKVPLVAFSNDVTVAGNGVYLLGYAPEQSIQRVVAYARGRGVTSFAGLVPTGAYGQRAGEAFRTAAGPTSQIYSFERSPAAITAAVTRAKQAGTPQAVLIADAGRVVAQAAPLLRKGAPNLRLLGTELWNTDVRLTGTPGVRGAWFASVSDGLYRQLATKYRARFGQAPYRLASLGYDAVLLVTRIAADWRVGAEFPEERLRDRGGFTGIDGAFRFGRAGIAERALEVQQVEPTGLVVVDPAPSALR